MPLDQFFSRALKNITKHGDTDIFPFPIENLIFNDKKQEVISLLKNMAGEFDRNLAIYPPANASTLAPVGYTGFRWATQIDPIWNAFYLGIVLSIAERIEVSRISKGENKIFSYRYSYDSASSDIFSESTGWVEYVQHSLKLSERYNWMVVCDISEFYPRLNHHKLENSIMQLNLEGNQRYFIREFLKNFSNTYSFGLPVGGPASRILSELLLDQVDRLLQDNGIEFCRFADDIHIFADSYENAFKNLVFLTDILFRNQGLQLQKSKTRIMASAEFQSTSPLSSRIADLPESSMAAQARELLRFSMRFDPYAANAPIEYERLRDQIQSLDVVGLLKEELAKSQIHVSLSKKLVSAIKFIREEQRGDALLSLIQNHDTLYPIFPNALMTIKSLFFDVDRTSQDLLMSKMREIIKSGSHVMSVDLNMAYAIRLLSCAHSDANSEILSTVYKTSRNSLIRRDIILAMARWRKWSWLSDLRTSFRTLDPLERRAFIISSFYLTDEGEHWRDHVKSGFSPFEEIVCDWAASKVRQPGWEIPL